MTSLTCSSETALEYDRKIWPGWTRLNCSSGSPETHCTFTSMNSTLNASGGLRVNLPGKSKQGNETAFSNQNYTSEQSPTETHMKLPLSSGEDKYLRTTRRLRGPN